MDNIVDVCKISSDDLGVTVVDTEAYEMLKSAFDHISYLDDVIKEQEEVIADLTNKLNLYEE